MTHRGEDYFVKLCERSLKRELEIIPQNILTVERRLGTVQNNRYDYERYIKDLQDNIVSLT